MFKEIFLFDLKANLKRPTTWIFFSIFFALTALIVAAAGGLIGSSPSEANTVFNSALSCAGMLNAIVNNSLIGTVILVAIMAPAIQKDFQYNSHSIYFTKPISKFGYVFGRFFSAFITALVVLLGCVFAFLIMCNLPLYNEGKMGHYGLWNYLQGFVYLVIPNTFFIGVLFFAIVTYTRNMLSGYIASIVLLVLTGVAGSLVKDLDNSLIPSLIDPFGNTALGELTQYWSAQEKNDAAIPFTGYLLYNRLLWMSIAFALFGFTYWRFSFEQTTSSFNWFKKKVISESNMITDGQPSKLPVVTTVFDNALSWRLWASLTKLEYKNLVKSPFFIVISLLMGIVVYFNYDGDSWYGTRTLPVSYKMTENIIQFSIVFGLLLNVFYAGLLVWRERDAKMDEIISATPIKTWVLLFSKITSLVLMYSTLIFLTVVLSVIIQLSNGFTDIQLLVYIKSLFGYQLVQLFITISLLIAVQVLVNNRYIGYFVCVCILIILPIVLSKMDIQNSLLGFNSSGMMLPYSDMNGFGHTFDVFILLKTYWLAFITLLLMTANLFWSRGKEQGFKSRFVFAKKSFGKLHLTGYVVALLVMIGFGGFIHYNTRVLNKYETADQQDERLANAEKRNKKYNRLAKLKVVDVTVDLAIYPETRSIELKGDFWLKNKNTKVVDTLFMEYIAGFTNYQLSFVNHPVKTIVNNTLLGEKVLVFENPIPAGDSVEMKFSYIAKPKGFKQGDAQTEIVFNGTFLNSQLLFPTMGYHEDTELDDKLKRAKYGLKPKERMHAISEIDYLNINCLTPDADWVRYECTISTADDQTAISPGYLVKKWTTNNRNYFHYKMDKPINYFMSYQSARYEVKTSQWHDVAIEIYYDKHHPYNIDKMISGVTKSLDYYTKQFSPYQFKQLRIQEFPRYQSFAQSFANTIPFSESIGFIAAPDFTEEDAIDYAFFVTAHEVAHQWWAHQVIGGNVKGCAMISESFAEYSALRVMEKEYGKKAMRKFLKHELNQYLRGRANNNRDEDALLYCQGDPHIHYQKGAVVMYGMSDLIGEQAMNDVLKAYVNKTAFQEPPYTTSLEFETMLKTATPDSLQYAIVDGFEKITLYENRCKDVSFTKLPNGKYRATIIVDAMKLYADAKGKKTQSPMADYIDIAVFAKGKTDKDPIELYNIKHKLKSGINTFEVFVDKEPYSAGIDPYLKLVDRNSDDNVRKVTDKKPLKPIDLSNNGGDIYISL